MRVLLCAALLCAVGCASAPVAAPVHEGHEGTGIQHWVPDVFADLWETFDADIGMDYKFGAHLKLTDLARIGIIDYSDFTLLGIDKDIFYGEWSFPEMGRNESWDLAATVGVGLGASAALHTWEVIDFFSSVIGFGYWSLDGD